MRRLVVVADDLTGACDGGVQFRKSGLRTMVWLDHLTPHDAPECDVLVVDTGSRAATPGHAYARMHALLSRLGPLTPRTIVHKIDSTLRGNIGPELRALLEALPSAFAIVCPAFPKQGRTVRDGSVYVGDTPVHHTDFGRDLFSPVGDARIGAHLETPHALLALESVRAGPNALNEQIERIRAHGVRVAVADAETDEDLHALAALAHLRDDILWVVSAGLLSCHPELVEGCATIAPTPPCHPELVEGCATIVVGSISAMTQRQIAAFAAHPNNHIEILEPTALLENTAAIARSIARAAAAVAHSTDTMIALDGRDIDAALALGRARGWDVHETSRRIREALVASTDDIIDSNGGGSVVLSGGDVARTFCERRGIRGLELLDEAAPGIPFSRAIGANLHLVTKAGGFGHPETYRDVVAFLRAKVTA